MTQSSYQKHVIGTSKTNKYHPSYGSYRIYLFDPACWHVYTTYNQNKTSSEVFSW